MNEQTNPTKIASECVVSMHYKLFESKTRELLDETHQTPLEFLVGRNNIIPALEDELIGLATDESKDVLIPSKEAYGEYDKEAIEEVEADQFNGIELQEGMMLYAHDKDNQTVPVKVKSFDDKNVMIDYNHPLAGKDLMFSITVAEIRKATDKELEMGYPEKESEGGCCGGGGKSNHGCGCH